MLLAPFPRLSDAAMPLLHHLAAIAVVIERTLVRFDGVDLAEPVLVKHAPATWVSRVFAARVHTHDGRREHENWRLINPPVDAEVCIEKLLQRHSQPSGRFLGLARLEPPRFVRAGVLAPVAHAFSLQHAAPPQP